MPVEADGVAHSPCEDLQVSAVRIHAHDGGEPRVALFAHVAWRSDRDVEPAVRSEADELPAMVGFVRERVVHDHRSGRICQAVFDVVKAEHPAHLRHVEGAVAERDPVGHLQAPGDGEDLPVPPPAVPGRDGIYLSFFPGADEQGAFRSKGQGSRAGEPSFVEFDGESLRQPYLVQLRPGA